MKSKWLKQMKEEKKVTIQKSDILEKMYTEKFSNMWNETNYIRYIEAKKTDK